MELHPICIIQTHIVGEMLTFIAAILDAKCQEWLVGGGGETVLAVPAVTELGKEVQDVTTGEEQQGALGIPDKQHRTSPRAARGKIQS